jgi:hypothetical protein
LRKDLRISINRGSHLKKKRIQAKRVSRQALSLSKKALLKALKPPSSMVKVYKK